jgi:hypothetical protein
MWFVELYKFVFSNFWIWLGSLILLLAFKDTLRKFAFSMWEFFDPVVRRKINREQK